MGATLPTIFQSKSGSLFTLLPAAATASKVLGINSAGTAWEMKTIDKTFVGLGNVDNTSDLSKPIPTLTQAALDLKAPLASPTFTGTVSGITKSMVGLGSVENTALSTWAGSTNITTLGTIATGTWQGTIIGPTYLGTGSSISTKYLRGDGTWQTVSAGAGLGDTNTWTAQNTFSLNGAASTPPVTLTGTWFTGGSATTTKPQLLVEPTGTTSTGWDTSGTGLGVNAASGFAGNLIDLQAGGSRRFYVNNSSSGEMRLQAIDFRHYQSGSTANGVIFRNSGSTYSFLTVGTVTDIIFGSGAGTTNATFVTGNSGNFQFDFQVRARGIGGASNDATQDALRIQPRTTLGANYRALAFYAASGDTVPIALINKSGAYVSNSDTQGVVLKSPDGHYWRVTVSNAGALATADLGTTLPT